ncbi:CrcB protein [Thermincola potens JR]|uniref:Fluoride-specific ion channel FluC n=1 Tax=Thermincola potens (strain JR) TaxID=635013 RepID=D5XBR0_THEPJ|nr:CrcB protein [Thermincola potens JR]
MDYIAVGLAGFLGAVTRVFLGKIINTWLGWSFPVNTLIINLTGCFALSFFLTLTLERLEINPRLRLAIGTGFLGAYTTFSTFAVESINLIRNQQVWPALVYLLATPLGCVTLAWAGSAAAKALVRRQTVEEEPLES